MINLHKTSPSQSYLLINHIYFLKINTLLQFHLKQIIYIMQKDKGPSFKDLQSKMKRELSKLSQATLKSQTNEFNFSKLQFSLLEKEPQRTTAKSTSSRKVNNSLSFSSKPSYLNRQCSLESKMLRQTSINTNLRSGASPPLKLKKKKKPRKDQSQHFLKLERGETLPESSTNIIYSTTSLQLKCDDSLRNSYKSPMQYEAIIQKYRKRVEELEKIIEQMIQN